MNSPSCRCGGVAGYRGSEVWPAGVCVAGRGWCVIGVGSEVKPIKWTVRCGVVIQVWLDVVSGVAGQTHTHTRLSVRKVK